MFWLAVLRYVAVDDLSEANVAALGGEVEGLRLDACRIHRVPLQVLLLELRVGLLLP